MLLVDGAHESGSWWEDLVDEDEDCLLWAELDALADHVDELANCEVGRNEVLLLVDRRNVGLFHLLANDLHEAVSDTVDGLKRARAQDRVWFLAVFGMTYGNPVGVLLTDALSFGLALLEWVLVLELGAHVGDVCCGGDVWLASSLDRGDVGRCRRLVGWW